MARYKLIDMNPRLLLVVFEERLVPVSFARALHHLIDRPDLPDFDAQLRKNTNGFIAYRPTILLKATAWFAR